MSFIRDLKLYLTEKPYYLIITKDRSSDSIITNIANDRYTRIPVTDIRGYERHFALDTHGFQLIRHTTSNHHPARWWRGAAAGKTVDNRSLREARLMGLGRVIVR